jgi:hypothetical protein
MQFESGSATTSMSEWDYCRATQRRSILKASVRYVRCRSDDGATDASGSCEVT